jgi:predicted phosphodiesterase
VETVIVIPDIHAPWSDINKISAIYTHIAKIKPSVVIQIGDALDLFSFSKFAKTLDLCTPTQELKEGLEFLQYFWHNVKKQAPKARCIQLAGNHEARIMKRVYEKCPEVASLIHINDLFKFKGVETITDPRDFIEVDNVVYTHGWFSQPGAHMRFFQKPVVFGHTHRASLSFTNQYGKTIWEMNIGYLADMKSVPMSYTSSKLTGWVSGFGVVDSLGPRFIPL